MTLELVGPEDRAPVTVDTDSWTLVVAEVGKLAAMIAPTDFVPESFRGSAPTTAAAILYGREVGLGPMTSLTQIYVTNGKPAMFAEGMRALVLAAGHTIEVVESTGATCTMRGRRRGADDYSAPVTWSLDMARAAGLLPARAGSAWLSYPRSMLVARCTAELCRRDFPDVIHGLVAREEVDDVTTEDGVDRTRPAGPTRVARRPRAKAVAAAPSVPETPPGPDIPPPEPTPAERPTDPPVDPPIVDPEPGPPETSSDSGSAEVEVEVVDEPPPPEPPRTLGQRTTLILRFRELGVSERSDRLDYMSALVGRQIETSNTLTRREASHLIDTLALCATAEDLDALVATAIEHAVGPLVDDGPNYPDPEDDSELQTEPLIVDVPLPDPADNE